MNGIVRGFFVAIASIAAVFLTACGSSSNAPQRPLKITVTSLPDGTIGSAYSQTIEAENGSAPFQWSVISGALPDQVALSNSASSSVLISGMPNVKQVGVTFTVQVKDSKGKT